MTPAEPGDLPYVEGRPVAISPCGWALVVASTVLAFLILVAPPAAALTGAAALLHALAFTALPLATLAAVTGGAWTALFRAYGPLQLRQSIGFAFLTLAVSLLAGLMVAVVAPVASNPVGDVLARMSGAEIPLFMLRTFVQLIGEEVVSILLLLAVMWLCASVFRLPRHWSLGLGVAVSTLWFAAMHLPTYDWNILQCVGVIGAARLVLTWAYLRTRNLWVSSGAHVLNDWSIFAFDFAGGHGPVGVETLLVFGR